MSLFYGSVCRAGLGLLSTSVMHLHSETVLP